MSMPSMQRPIRTLTALMMLSILAACSGQEEAAQPNETDSEPVSSAVIVATYPADGASLHRLDHPLTVRFSEPVDPAHFSFTLKPDPGSWQVAWRDNQHKAVLHSGAPFKAGIVHTWTMALKPGSRQKTLRFTPYGPSSLDLIDAAQDTGILDPSTAWTYRLQRIFDPEALPSEYRSPTPVPDADKLVRGYMLARADFEPGIARQLNRYVKRPTDPGSFFHKHYAAPQQASSSPFWGVRQAFAEDRREPYTDYVDCAKGRVRIWAPRNRMAKAVEARDMIDNEDMYNDFLRVIHTVPLDDITDEPDNGGDDRIDIYLVPFIKTHKKDAAGLCVPTAFLNDRQSSAFINVDWSLTGKDLGSTLAHELFHAFQFSYDVKEMDWWMESTATWSEDYINAAWNTEQRFLDTVFTFEDNQMVTLTADKNNHEYGIYLFPFYLSQEFNDRIIGDIWQQCLGATSLQAIDSVLGFDKVFKQFCLFNLDAGPYEGKYMDNGVPLKLFDYHDVLELDLESEDKQILEEGKRQKIALPPLSAKYVEVYNLIDKEKTPLVNFKLRQFANKEDLQIQAVVDLSSEGRYEDWTGATEKTFCLNRDDDFFTTIGLVISNKSTFNAFEPELIIDVDAGGCSQKNGYATVSGRWHEKGQTDWEHVWPSGERDSRKTRSDSQIDATVSFSFELMDAAVNKATNSITETYQITDAHIKSFSFFGQSEDHEFHYADKCSWETTRMKKARPGTEPQLKHTGGLSITFDMDTGKAKWVGLPALVVTYAAREHSTAKTTGCRSRDPEDEEFTLPAAPFTIGPLHGTSGDELREQAAPELAEIEQIAREMQEMFSNPQNMDLEQVRRFAEEFSQRHDTDKITRNMEPLLVSPDLKATGGDGRTSIKGGGTKSETLEIPDGTKHILQGFSWQIFRRDNAGE